MMAFLPRVAILGPDLALRSMGKHAFFKKKSNLALFLAHMVYHGEPMESVTRPSVVRRPSSVVRRPSTPPRPNLTQELSGYLFISIQYLGPIGPFCQIIFR